MKNLFFVLCCFLLAATVQCQKKESFKESPITGTWVETTTKTDTLEFLPEYDGTNPILWLKRGKNDDNLPKIYSGPYSYELSGNSITMNWFLSSNMSFHEYFFEPSPDKEILKIGNFYNNPYDNKDTLIFRMIN